MTTEERDLLWQVATILKSLTHRIVEDESAASTAAKLVLPRLTMAMEKFQSANPHMK